MLTVVKVTRIMEQIRAAMHSNKLRERSERSTSYMFLEADF